MITYGHEKFIEQAINGVLMQECDFEVELIIANDCSPDRTDAVIQNILKNHPRASWIKYIKHEKNLGMMPNFIFALQECQGKYVALCDGDDYWTDAFKLQKQVDFLESNPKFGICFHSVEEISLFEISKNRIFPNIGNNIIYDIEDYILNNRTATCSIVFNRKSFIVPDWFIDLPFGDLGLVLIIMNNFNKKAMVLKDVMGVYRIHSGGIHGKFQENTKILIKAYIQQLSFTKMIESKLFENGMYGKVFLKKKSMTYTILSKLYMESNQNFMAKYISFKLLILKARKKIF